MSLYEDQVSDIAIYPIKSCHAATVNGHAVSSLEVGPTGFQVYDVRDREFVLVDAEPETDGRLRFISQRGWGENGRLAYRNDSQMAAFETNITEDSLTVSSKIGELVIGARYSETDRTNKVRVHGSTLTSAFDQGPRAADYFTELFERPVRLARANRSEPRFLKGKYWRPNASNQVAGADSMPFLLINRASVAACEQEFGKSVPTEQYRPNITLHGFYPFIEDSADLLLIGEMAAYVVKACARCPIPNIDQNTGERTTAGMKILGNRRGYINPDDGQDVFMGQNLNHVYVPGTVVSVGDRVDFVTMHDTPNFTLL